WIMNGWTIGVMSLSEAQHSITPLLHYSNFNRAPRSAIFLPREPPRIFVVMLIIPVSDLPSRGTPDSFVGAHIIECFVQIFDAKRHADNKRMKRQTKHSPA